MEKKDATIGSWLFLALFGAFMFAVFAPVDIYYANEGEFWFYLYQMLPLILPVFAGLFAVLAALFLGLGRLFREKKAGYILYTVFFHLLMYFYIQGNYVPRNYGVLNGMTIDWKRHPFYGHASIFLIVCAVLGAAFSIWKIREKIFVIGRFLCVILLLSLLVTIGVTAVKNIEKDDALHTDLIVTDRELDTLGSQENIIVFVLDQYDSKHLRDLMEDPAEWGDVREIFRDFTYYPDTLGVYPTTKGALPQLLTGQCYYNEKPYTDYITEAYENTTFYDTLKNEDWQVCVYTQNTFVDPDCDKYANIEAGRYRIGDSAAFLKNMYSLVAFNYMPHQLKHYFFVDTEDFERLRTTPEGGDGYMMDVQQLYEKLSRDGLHTGSCEKSFHFIHTNGTHNPYTYDRDLHTERDGVYDVLDAAAGNCKAMALYLDDLRACGAYDNATIVITADHGKWGYSQNPLFLVKTPGEEHPFAVSEVKMSNVFLNGMLEQAACGSRIDETLIAKTVGDGSRRYLQYVWDDGWEKQYLPEIEERMTEGVAWDDDALLPTGEVYRPQASGHTEPGILVRPLIALIKQCYRICGNYALAIVLFTLITKLVLLPISVWTHKNSIRMIEIQPEINELKARYFGQNDIIGEKQTQIFKEKGYHPLLSAVPMIVQLLLLIGVVEAVKAGMADPEISMRLGAVRLDAIPSEEGLALLWSPLLAAASAWLLSVTQNASNVLQAEQSKLNQYGMMVLTVGLSLFLGYFVAVGTALYWIASNVFAILQMYALNALIPPKKYVDYERLEKSREALAALGEVGGEKKNGWFSEAARRERKDYKRFFSVRNKHLVFYAEGKGFYKYFKGFIEYILKYTNLTIHYITGDPSDPVLTSEEERIRAYYIGEKRMITLLMKLETDVCVMTTPDLEHYHLKRSHLRKDVHYIYVQHNIGSNNLTMRKKCMECFDTVFCADVLQAEEERAIETTYGLKEKTLLPVGYPLLDEMREAYREKAAEAGAESESAAKKILIAPSWQADNITDTCLEEILRGLEGKGYAITVRPHPQEVRHKAAYMETLKAKYAEQGITIQTDFSSNTTVTEADLLITDWSGIAWEYGFTTGKPVLFIDTPMKIMNPDYKEIGIEPFDLRIRDEMGGRLAVGELPRIGEKVRELLDGGASGAEKAEALVQRYIPHPGESAAVGGDYIVNVILEKIRERKEQA